MISHTTTDIINALLELSRLPSGQSEGAVRIAQKIHAPRNYLAKTLQKLARQGLVASQKGLNGGFRLAKPAAEIRLYDVVEVVEDLGRFSRCCMGRGACSSRKPCSLHNRWQKVQHEYIDFLQGTTIADIKEI